MDTPLDSLPPVPPDEETQRFLRLFGDRRLSQFQTHRVRMKLGPQWFVFVDPPVARCFTRWVRPVRPVRNPRSITGSQKFIASAKNSGVIF